MFAKVKGARTRPHGLAEMWDAGTANAMPIGSDALLAVADGGLEHDVRGDDQPARVVGG
jgi:hypothetical protein